MWLRELRRPEDERSPGIIAHELERSLRLADAFAREIDINGVNERIWHGPFNMVQMTLIVALQMELRLESFAWRTGRPGLVTWSEALARRPSIEATYGLE